MRALLLLACLLAVPLASAQSHEHGGDAGMAMVLYDGPANGRAVVNAYTHLGFALLDKDGVPVVHQDAEFNVLQGGEVLFSTTDAHEYDGLFSLDLRFTKPGPYQVVARSGEMALGVFEGEVVEPQNATAAVIDLVATPEGPGSRLMDLTIAVNDEAGQIIPHTDAIVEFRNARDGSLVGRTHLHIHEDPIQFTQALGPELDFVARVIGYKAFATGRSTDVVAVSAEFPLTVGPAAVPGLPTPDVAVPEVLGQVGGVASADGLTLHVMFDPNQQVGQGQLARIAGVVVEDANRSPLAHVDFAMALTGPRGPVFASGSGHEYDGMWEYAFVPDVVGVYDGVLWASYDETELSVPFRLQVVPPALAGLGSTGLVQVAVDGLDDAVAGQPSNFTFSAMGSGGPAAHSEVDVTVFHDGEPPLYQFKLHTHGSGLTNAMLTFPHGGAWTILVDPLPTSPDAAVFPPAVFQLEVAPGTLGADGGGLAAGATAERALPQPALALVALAVGVALALTRRR